MTDPQKTVFISYRHTSHNLEEEIFDQLYQRGYDVFLDLRTTETGLDATLSQQIAARAHFIVSFYRGGLRLCQEPDDILRLEIEEAVRLRRHIIPIFIGFGTFDNEISYLPEHLNSEFRNLEYAWVFLHSMIEHDWDRTIDHLVNRFLNQSVSHIPITPIPLDEQTRTQQKMSELAQQLDKKLRPYEYFQSACRKHGKGDLDGAIADYSEVIRLKPNDFAAFNNRALVFIDKGDFQAAIKDCTSAIRLTQYVPDLYRNRGRALHLLGDLKDALWNYQIYFMRGGSQQTDIEEWITEIQKELNP